MGAGQAADNRRQINGSIQVQIQKLGFIGGEMIQGILNVNLQETFPGHVLQVSLMGLENTHFTYTVSSGSGKHRHTRTVHAYGLNKFLDFAIPVYDFALGSSQGSMQPGQWQIPFQISIAAQLPSSFTFNGSPSNNCALKYQIVGTLISVQADIDMMKVDAVLESIVIPKICCCCTSGPIKLLAISDKASYAPGEIAHINVTYDLNSYSKSLERLSIRIIGVLVMKANKSIRTKTNILNVAEGQIHIRGKQQSEKVSILIPPTTGLTCTGDFVNIVYYIEVKPQIDSCCCVSMIPVMIPIRINPTPTTLNMIQMPQLMQMQAPAGWNPMMLQPAVFTEQQNLAIQQQQAMLKHQEMQMYQQYLNDSETQGFKQPNSGQIAPGQSYL